MGLLCLASIRMGNFMNAEIVGAPTDVSWAVIFPAVDDIPRHPVQLYGFIVYLSLFFFMLKYNKAKSGKVIDGHIFGVFIAILGTLRFFMEFIKRHYVIDAESLFNMAQYLSIPLIIFGILLAVKTKNKNETQVLNDN